MGGGCLFYITGSHIIRSAIPNQYPRIQKCFTVAAMTGFHRGKHHVCHGECNICDIQETILDNQLTSASLPRKLVLPKQ